MGFKHKDINGAECIQHTPTGVDANTSPSQNVIITKVSCIMKTSLIQKCERFVHHDTTRKFVTLHTAHPPECMDALSFCNDCGLGMKLG